MQSNHSQEISQIHIQSMETIEQMRVKYESQLDNNKSVATNVQNDLHSKVLNYEQQVSGWDITIIIIICNNNKIVLIIIS